PPASLRRPLARISHRQGAPRPRLPALRRPPDHPRTDRLRPVLRSPRRPPGRGVIGSPTSTVMDAAWPWSGLIHAQHRHIEKGLKPMTSATIPTINVRVTAV